MTKSIQRAFGMRRFGAGWLLMAAGMVATSVSAQPELVLTGQGKCLAPIIVFEGAPPMTRQAADELAEYIEKIGGAKPEVIEGLPDPLPENAIWIGYQPVLDKLFPEIDFAFKHPEEILIAASDQHLVIGGRDRWDPAHTEFKGGAHGPTCFGQQEYGTANAVYTFIQDYLGVRWLWQGEEGEDVVRRERIAFAPFEYRYHPPIRMRRYVMWWTCRPLQRGRLCTEWARRQRLLLDSTNPHSMPDGHAFGDWWERFHETHPEYFALQPDGSRGYHPQLGPGSVKICKSNPAVWEQWLADVGTQLDEDPTRTLFRGAVNDGNLAGYCVCENCKAWDAPEAEARFLVWGGHSETYVAMSDRQTRFANQLARRLRERYPDKGYKVMMLAYGPSRPAPLENKPDDNVIVLHCTNWFADMDDTDPRSPVGTRSAQQFADWATIGANLWWRPNLPGQGGMYHGIPDVPFGRAAQQIHFLAANNCTGLAPACFWNFWPTQGPLYYMLAHLAWDPTLDGNAILDDYYRRGFGKAHEQLKTYWTLMEETRNRKVDGKLEFWQAYDAAWFERTGGLLDEAVAVLAGEPEKYRRRVAHVRIGLDFTRLVVEAYELKDRYKTTPEDAANADKLRANLTALKGMVRGDTTYYMGPTYHFEKWLNEPKELWNRP